MECIRCWKDSKYQFCRKCKEEKHKAGAIISQNKTKLRNLLEIDFIIIIELRCASRIFVILQKKRDHKLERIMRESSQIYLLIL